MVVRKILETTLAAGSTSVTFTDSEIPYSLIRVYASNPDVLPTERILSGNTVTVKYEAQSSSMGVALEIVKAGLEVIDNLTSTDDTAALSANQGKLLKDAIDALTVPDLSDLPDVTITDATDGQVLTYDDGVWINYTPVSDLSGLSDVDITSATDGQVLVYDDNTDKWINESISMGINTYHLDWTATGSSASGTTLTESINLPAGKYIVISKSPYSASTGQFYYGVFVNDSTVTSTIVLSTVCYGLLVAFVELSETSSVKIVSGSSTSGSWDSAYLDRGGVNIIKL